MSIKPYDFETQRRVGQEGETFLDRWLGSNHKVLNVSGDARYQRAGIDRVLTRRDNSTITVEYKFDLAARRTGNLFFETMSNDSRAVPGWGWSSQADYWIFLIPGQEILVFNPGQLRSLAWDLHDQLRRRAVPNRGYSTIGYPIPLVAARKAADEIILLNSENLPPVDLC